MCGRIIWIVYVLCMHVRRRRHCLCAFGIKITLCMFSMLLLFFLASDKNQSRLLLILYCSWRKTVWPIIMTKPIITGKGISYICKHTRSHTYRHRAYKMYVHPNKYDKKSFKNRLNALVINKAGWLQSTSWVGLPLTLCSISLFLCNMETRWSAHNDRQADTSCYSFACELIRE